MRILKQLYRNIRFDHFIVRIICLMDRSIVLAHIMTVLFYSHSRQKHHQRQDPDCQPDSRFFIRSLRFQHHVHSNRNQYQNSPEHRVGYHADIKAERIRTDTEYSNHRVRIKQKFYLKQIKHDGHEKPDNTERNQPVQKFASRTGALFPAKYIIESFTKQLKPVLHDISPVRANLFPSQERYPSLRSISTIRSRFALSYSLNSESFTT